MTRIEFHFNTSERLVYTCRLVRKARAQNLKVAVIGAPVTLSQLDTEMWGFSEGAFLAHCTPADSIEVQQASPIGLGPDPHAWDFDELLVNLGDDVPVGFERFKRLVEIVSNDDHGRAQARQRWKHYKSKGYELLQHDLSKTTEK